MRILLVRLSALGDILHALPALAAIREALPDAHIGWLVEDRGAEIIQGHPQLDRVHVVPRRAIKAGLIGALRGPVRELARELRRERYDVAIDFQGLTKSAVWTRLCGAGRRIGFKGENAQEISSFFYNESVPPKAGEDHVIRMNLALLRPLGIEDPRVRFVVHFSEEVKARGEAIWGADGNGHPKIIINPGAGWETKRWPPANFGRLAQILVEKTGARVALAWGPGEEPLITEAFAAAGLPEPEIGAPGAESIGTSPGLYVLPPTRFAELGAAIAHADLFVGGDTGPTHYAAALGVPTVALYGGSDSRRNGPWGEAHEIIQLQTPPCIPCWRTRCNWNEPLACLTQIGVERVAQACRRLIESNPGA